MSLTTQQEQVLALLSAGATIADAAQSAGIHRNTIHNWLRSAPEFQQALDQARQAKALYWQEQAEQLAPEALATIRTLMTDPKTPPATRLRAAQIILNLVTNPPAKPLKSVHKLAQSIPETNRFQEVPEDGQDASRGGEGASACGLGPEPQSEKVHNSALASAVARRERQLPYRRPNPKIGRNELCPCGSGKKFKRCCVEKIGFVPVKAPEAA